MNLGSFDAIIFDLGGVILNIDYQKTIHAFEELGDGDFREMYSQAEQSQLFDLFETGKISQQRFINDLLPYLKQGTTANKVVAAWNAMILDVPPAKLDLLAKVRSSVPIFLLSNTNEIHLQAVHRQWLKVTNKPLEEYFDKVYLSHEIGLRKPHVETFNFVCNEQGLIPEKTLFIDDSIQHVEGARKAGLHAVLLEHSEDLYTLFS